MKVVILAGGLGTRLSELTKIIPKPMVKINKKPIIKHIIDHYISFGHKEFIVALGYKGHLIKKYFQKLKKKNFKIKLVNTGSKTMTGGRLKLLEKYLDKTFLMTYGDGLSSVNINKLISFHKKNKKLFTLTAVRPPARFGAIKIKRNHVSYFKEKNSLDEGWINGGFFVIEKKFLKFIRNKKTFLEKEPFELLTQKKQMTAYKFNGFWQCMDTIRDREILEKAIKKKKHLD